MTTFLIQIARQKNKLISIKQSLPVAKPRKTIRKMKKMETNPRKLNAIKSLLRRTKASTNT